MHKVERAENKNPTIIIIFVIAVIIMIAVMFVTVFTLKDYVNESVHNERMKYLTVQTTTTADLVNRAFGQYADYISVCESVIEDDLQEGANVYEFLDEIAPKVRLNDLRVLLIDSNCTWYGTDSASGRITAVDQYTADTPDTLIYLTTGVDSATECLVYRNRLKTPVTLTSEHGEVLICYCAAVYYLDSMENHLSNSFPYECNSFIVDETGLMLYKNLKLGLLMRGSNLFSKYERVEFLYGGDGNAQLEQLKNGEAVVGEFLIDGHSYFICSAPMDINNWFISYVVDSDSLNVGSYVSSMFIYVSVIAIIFAVAVLLAGTAMFSMRVGRKQLLMERKANAYLEKASNAKSEFLSNMSHDIRTPINGIMGLTAIASKENNPARTEDCLKKIDVTSKYLLSLVNDVLDMSSIESGKLTIRCEETDMRELIENTMGIVQGQALNRKLRFVTDTDRITHSYVMADALHLRQVFINILGNAVKFTNDGGMIAFRAYETAFADNTVTVRFEFEDTGIGMDAEFLKNIWNRFSQENGGARTKYKGTGLGMAISKKLVELMGGDILVESELNVGTKFTVEIPFECTDKTVEAEREEAGEPSIEGVKILLAEDNEINMEVATELLESEGAIITPAENGRIALEVFDASQPGDFDVILMDIMMPEMNGYEATRAIRKLDRDDASSIPIIAMTANAFDEDIRAAMRAGMDAHLSKPIDMQQVIKTVSRFSHRGH